MEGAIEDGLPYLRPIPKEDDPRHTAPESIMEVSRFNIDVAVRAYA
jgi:hypothetical protein